MVILVLPISTTAYRMPTQGQHAHSVQLAGDIPRVETCKMAANSEKESLPSPSSPSSKQMVTQPSFCEG